MVPALRSLGTLEESKGCKLVTVTENGYVVRRRELSLLGAVLKVLPKPGPLGLAWKRLEVRGKDKNKGTTVEGENSVRH